MDSRTKRAASTTACTSLSAFLQLHRSKTGKGPPFLRQSTQKGSGFPAAAVHSMEFKHARIYICESKRIGIKHRSSAIWRKPVTGQIDDIDVDRAQRIPLFENSGALIDQGVSTTVQNLFIP